MGWSGGRVPFKSRHWLLSSFFWRGDEDPSALPKITAHPAQRRSKPRKITASPSQICRIPLSIPGVPSDLRAMEWACWEECPRRLEAAFFPRLYPRLLLTPLGLMPGDREESGAHGQDQPRLVRDAALVSGAHQPQPTGVTHQKGNDLKLGKLENGFHKA